MRAKRGVVFRSGLVFEFSQFPSVRLDRLVEQVLLAVERGDGLIGRLKFILRVVVASVILSKSNTKTSFLFRSDVIQFIALVVFFCVCLVVRFGVCAYVCTFCMYTQFVSPPDFSNLGEFQKKYQTPMTEKDLKNFMMDLIYLKECQSL